MKSIKWQWVVLLWILLASRVSAEDFNYLTVVRVSVSATGKVEAVEVLDWIPQSIQDILNQQAWDWEFEPAMRNGKPVTSNAAVNVHIHFVDRGDGTMVGTIDRLTDTIAPRIRYQPTYPAWAAKKRIEGEVELEFTITKHGWVKNIEVKKSLPRGVFDVAAANAVSKWRFDPQIVNGEAIEIRATQVIEFQMSLDDAR